MRGKNSLTGGKQVKWGSGKKILDQQYHLQWGSWSPFELECSAQQKTCYRTTLIASLQFLSGNLVRPTCLCLCRPTFIATSNNHWKKWMMPSCGRQVESRVFLEWCILLTFFDSLVFWGFCSTVKITIFWFSIKNASSFNWVNISFLNYLHFFVFIDFFASFTNSEIFFLSNRWKFISIIVMVDCRVALCSSFTAWNIVGCAKLRLTMSLMTSQTDWNYLF